MRGFDPNAPALKPSVDGDVIPEHPFRVVGANPTPLLAGSTTQEINGTVRMNRKDLEAVAPDALTAMKISGGVRTAYASHVGSDDPVDLLAQAATDRAFRVPLAKLLEDRATQGTPTWGYQFAWHTPDRKHSTAMHCIDVPFAFDNLDADGVTDAHRVGTGAPQHLADEMHREWVSFVKDGTVSWPVHTPDDRAVMVFDRESSVVPDALRAERELL